MYLAESGPCPESEENSLVGKLHNSESCRSRNRKKIKVANNSKVIFFGGGGVNTKLMKATPKQVKISFFRGCSHFELLWVTYWFLGSTPLSHFELLLPFFDIYIYAGELMGCPRFGLQRVNGLAPLKVNRLSTFLGAIFAL